ncbi:replication initiation protein [Bacillus subtilis]|uniref:replication initiation protein n=2 Tax=Bacillus subtilis TaxID=1423 RepID=UPI0027E0B9D5|nr:replication initiation protein [Bacillus subtilis]MDQ4712326.1 replication initiation protein [Bacillus subtilis]MEC1264971.1 replication initiation protein [Bacillus subtilis]
MPQTYSKSKGKRFVPDPDKYLYNIDTFWFNVDCSNYQDIMDEGFGRLLSTGRENYMDTGQALTVDVKISAYENPVLFEILGGQPPAYQYSIRNKDMAIYFAKNAREDQMPMKVQLNQFLLWEKGILNAYYEALSILTVLGFDYTSAKLNRVDFAVHSDQWRWNYSDLSKFEYPQNFAKDNHPDFFRLDPSTGDFETVYYGNRTRCQLRIYNKSKEAIKKMKTYFLDLYREKGMDAENVWNVEFEVRRDFIKECKDLEGMRLFDDLDTVFYENRLSLLWSYLMERYIHPSAHWKTLSKGHKGVFEQVTGYITREKDMDLNFEREIPNIRGRLITGLVDENDYDLDTALQIVKEGILEYEKRKNVSFEHDVVKKKKLFLNHSINKKIQDKHKKMPNYSLDS